MEVEEGEEDVSTVFFFLLPSSLSSSLLEVNLAMTVLDEASAAGLLIGEQPGTPHFV